MFNDKLKRTILSRLHGHFFKINTREFIRYTAYRYWSFTESTQQKKYESNEIMKDELQLTIVKFVLNESE